jgi:small subunit ribosomal protein S1
VPGKVTKLVPFGAFVRVDDGIEGLVHISELAERHVELPEQVVQVGSDVLVKVIDIDLERRRISLSLKQANEGFVEGEEHFDPTLYGMAATYDTEGNYIYPEGFDPETGEWMSGFEKQREAWERQYADARERWEAHTKQVQASREADADAALNPAPTGNAPAAAPSSGTSASPAPARSAEEPSGTLATDEALAALREKLAGGKN